jgi:ActR/RegA family two-component response regulator
MRILIADRNVRLLEAISRTFARQFSIQTATTHEHCNDLLLQREFDLAVISEKLADGPGLQLLGQIARNSPDTLRVFAARRSRLQLLKGKLGPFGLFRTLAYPIDPQELLSALTLARTGLEIDVPALETRADPVLETRNVPAPAATRPTVERISLTSADVKFAIDVPTMIASMGGARRSNLPSAPRLAPVAPVALQASAPQRQATASRARSVALESPSDAPLSDVRQSQQAAVVRSAAPPRLSSQSEGFELVEEPRKTVDRVVSWSSRRESMRTKFVLAATVVGVFLVTTLTLNLFDANVHVTRASTPRPEIARSDVPAPPRNSTPVALTPAFNPAPSAARHVAPKPDATQPDVEPSDPQVAASATPPIADPSTFGSEAYEPIYSN